MSLIRLADVTLGYERHPAVHHLSGVFTGGTATAIVGPNGAGKSTLLKGVMGLLRPLGGAIRLEGMTRRDMAYLPQQAEIDADFPMTVQDAVLLGFWRRIGAFGAVSRAMVAAAEAALDKVGLEGFARRQIAALSVGQRQRMLFARLLLQDCPVILLDEPFAAVDARTTHDLLGLMRAWRAEGRTLIAVLHDFDQVRRHFPHSLLLARELIAWGETGAVLTEDNLAAARAACDSWDEQAPLCPEGGE